MDRLIDICRSFFRLFEGLEFSIPVFSALALLGGAIAIFLMAFFHHG